MENMREVLGLPQSIPFNDKVSKMAYPMTMDMMPLFMENIAYVNYENLWKNFVYTEGKEALQKVLGMSFKDDKIEEIEPLINAGNFPNIIQTIMAMNGIETRKPDGEDEGKNKVGV